MITPNEPSPDLSECRQPPQPPKDRSLMTSKQRLLCALERRQPDRLPVTAHVLLDSFLDRFMHGASGREFFDRFGLDAIRWVTAHRPDDSTGEYYDPKQGRPDRK